MQRVYSPTPNKCIRCWHCCLSADYHTNFYLESRLPLQWHTIDGNQSFRMCPLLTVDEMGQPTCIIYGDHPSVCKEYHCRIVNVVA